MEEHLRIRFRRSPDAMSRDQTTMTRWAKGYIEADEGAQLMSEANLTIVTPEQFVENAEALGYHRFAKWSTVYEKWVPDTDALRAYEERQEKKRAREAYEQIRKAVKYG